MTLKPEFKEKFKNLLGEEEAAKLFAALNNKPKKTFRVNTLKKTAASLAEYEKINAIPNAYYGHIPDKNPLWTGGIIYSQDPSAMVPALAAAVQPNERVLDLCAAPGGKSTALAEKAGLLVANEISAKRAKVLRENIERWGSANTVITNCSSEKLATAFPNFFDIVVVDAPCSGEGMFNKNEAEDYWSPEYVLKCQERQKQILKQAVKMLRPGGRIVYSTCTFSPEEDEEVVDWLSKNYQMRIMPITAFASTQDMQGIAQWSGSGNTALKNTLRFWPQNGLGEGQFCSLLQSTNTPYNPLAESTKTRKRAEKKLHLNKQDRLLVEQLLSEFNFDGRVSGWRTKALLSHNHVYLPAIKPEQLHGLHVLNNGLELGILKKKRFEPSQWLAQYLAQFKQAKTIKLNDQDYLRYLHGETIKTTDRRQGFILVEFNNIIFSWGKLDSRHILKNFYPKGLRK